MQFKDLSFKLLIKLYIKHVNLCCSNSRIRKFKFENSEIQIKMPSLPTRWRHKSSEAKVRETTFCDASLTRRGASALLLFCAPAKASAFCSVLPWRWQIFSLLDSSSTQFFFCYNTPLWNKREEGMMWGQEVLAHI